MAQSGKKPVGRQSTLVPSQVGQGLKRMATVAPKATNKMKFNDFAQQSG